MSDPSSDSVFSEQQATQPNENQPDPTQQPNQEVPQQPNAPSDDLFADRLAAIKNESGESKYKDLPTALDALKHSQEYIPQLKSENETLKQEIERLKQNEERMAQLEQTIERLAGSQEEAPSTPQGTQGFTEEQIQELLDKRLSERELNQKYSSNSASVEQALRERFGEKAQEAVVQKAKEMDMTPAELGQWAAKSPKAVLALFGSNPSAQGGSYKHGSGASIPPVNPPQDEVKSPEKSLLAGASSKDQMEYLAKIRKSVYERRGITD